VRFKPVDFRFADPAMLILDECDALFLVPVLSIKTLLQKSQNTNALSLRDGPDLPERAQKPEISWSVGHG